MSRKLNSSAVNVDARRRRILESLCADKEPVAIIASESISRSTFWRDMEAIGEDYAAWAARRKGVALQLAIANYQYVVKTAKKDHDFELKNEEKWLNGAFATDVQVADAVDGARVESKTLQQYRTNKHAYLTAIINATKELGKLAGIEAAAKLELTGKNGGAIAVKNVSEMSDAELDDLIDDDAGAPDEPPEGPAREGQA